ncbi:MAG: branched-chain amino acid ABC transporter permease [Roseovarius sp.]|uniref:branched-chain amino acid ABC transporter permease n=1 Tax=Roseovarius sp. TaxID=1486281 RepID=UPI001B45459D|nr:branched-chain amino acid ABC transporter permease [Roseovarius sp.]MBQ0752432.1 branched-chain amino acid ABC transporter permease [Roseovarius sp.]MBQ0810362.1 branched-chain amino acid ABC transporter permease [Roseovarius sp.]
MTRERALNAALMALLLLIPIWAWAADEPFLITLTTRAVILAIAGVGLNIALGFGGLVSFGHALFFGLGGYAMGILAFHAQTYTSVTDWPLTIPGTKSMPVIWIIATLTSALAALAVGALSLRTTGVYFIMITLAFSQMFYYFAISWPTYGGEDGLSIYVRNGFPGFNTMDPIQFFALCYGLLALILFFTARLARSNFGLMLGAARQNGARVAAIGQRPYRLYLIAFTLSGAITGLAGALFADLNRFVSPVMFSWQTSGEIMVFVILGGVGRVFGPVAGAALFILLEHSLGGLSDYWHIYLGAILLGTVLFARGGLFGLLAGRGQPHD